MKKNQRVQILLDFGIHFEKIWWFWIISKCVALGFNFISYNFLLYVMYITPIYMWQKTFENLKQNLKL
jgi:hypothetical protein